MNSADVSASAPVAVAESAAREWTHLVATAVLGTDRKALPPAGPGWECAAGAEPAADSAVQLLDRAALVATARRAGVCAGPDVPLTAPPPPDDRPVCPAAAANALARMLRGEHDVLLPEWFERCAAAGMRPPPHLVPALLLRGRRNPALDFVSRRCIGPLAGWLADAMPELRLAALPAALAAGTVPLASPQRIADSGAAVTVVVTTFVEGAATWAMAASLRTLAAALDPSWLAALELELNRAPFRATTERTRVELIGLTQLRRAIIESMPPL